MDFHNPKKNSLVKSFEKEEFPLFTALSILPLIVLKMCYVSCRSGLFWGLNC